MPDIASLIVNNAANPWFYLPVAVLLGALHALEPGHSKSLMAAFIIAVRGTIGQAVVLGLSAAVGHTLVVWAVAMLGLWLGDRLILDRIEPWLVLIAGLMILAIAWRIYQLALAEAGSAAHAHAGHGHDHSHGHDHGHHHGHEHHHDHGHAPAKAHSGLSHAEMHEKEIQERYAGRRVSNRDVAWFGLTGGLLPCPAAIAVLLVCLQLREFTLGVAMVAAFSLGLAITLVSVGVLAAWGASAARKRADSRWSAWADRLPFVSAGVVAIVGLAITLRGMILLGWI